MMSIQNIIRFLLLITIVLNSFQLSAQEAVRLSDCQNWAREYHPILIQKDLYQKLSELELKNNSTNYLPSVILKGQATYQSDVTSIGIDLPNVEMPSVGKDQYKIYLDVRQNIWDGGVTQAANLIEQSKEQNNQQAVEVELYKVKIQVNQFFFTSFFIQENQNILKLKEETLTARRDLLNAGVKHGMILSADLNVVDAELIRIAQQQLELQTSGETVHAALAILTGKEVDAFENLKLEEQEFSSSEEISRPELNLFQSQNDLLQAISDLQTKLRNPKLFGFGQAGFGKPGLNMLQDKFTGYYLVGVGVSWNVFDWKKSARNRKSISLQKELVLSKQNQFEQSIHLGLDKETRKINQLKKIVKSDEVLITIQERITKSSSSKLENGAITIADYLQDLNTEMAARITYESHKIQLEQSKINYQQILGK